MREMTIMTTKYLALAGEDEKLNGVQTFGPFDTEQEAQEFLAENRDELARIGLGQYLGSWCVIPFEEDLSPQEQLSLLQTLVQPHVPTNAIPEQVEQIVAEKLSASRVTLITSDPGRGRNATLKSSLEEHFPGRHVIIDALSVSWDAQLIDIADELESADVVCIDSFSTASKEIRAVIMRLTADGTIGPLPVKWTESRSIRLKADSRFVFSESGVNGRNIVVSALSTEAVSFQGFDLTV